MVHFTGLLENARHPVAGPLSGDPVGGPLSGDPCKNRVRAGIGGWPGTATGGQIHVVHISHTHPPKEIIQALRKYLLGKKYTFWLSSTTGSGPCLFLSQFRQYSDHVYMLVLSSTYFQRVSVHTANREQNFQYFVVFVLTA